MSGGAAQSCIDLLALARAQRDALVEGRFDEAAAILEKRQAVLEEIQKVDGSPVPAEPVTAVIALDGEIASMLREEMKSVGRKLATIGILREYLYSSPVVPPGSGFERTT